MSVGRILSFKIFVFILLANIFIPQTFAASIESGESVYLAEDRTDLKDLYLFGSTVTTDANVENDLTVAAGTVTINGDVTGSLMAAGGDLFIRSNVDNTLRVAGGNVVISGEVKNDALIAGGNIRITDTASISGDLLIFGGDIQINGPVKGKIYISGGEATINANVGGHLEGEVGTLTLGNKANIKGDLRYKATKKAEMVKGSIVQGKTDFRLIEDKNTQKKTGLITAGSVYKLAIDIIISLLLITILPVFTKNTLERVYNAPLMSLGTGFAFLFFWPLLSIFLFFFIWLGFAAFLFYGLIIFTSIYLGKVFFGWLLLHHWYKREKKEYILNWKAAIVGSAGFYILFIIPIIGWLAVFIISLMLIGALIKNITGVIQSQTKKAVS